MKIPWRNFIHGKSSPQNKKEKQNKNQPTTTRKKKAHLIFNSCTLSSSKTSKDQDEQEARRLTSETYLISCSSEILNNAKRREEAKWFPTFLIMMLLAFSLNQFLSLPLRHLQTHLGTIQRETDKNSATHHVLIDDHLWEIKPNHILQNSFGSNAKWRAGNSQTPSTMLSMLFPATSVHCVNQQATRLFCNISAPPCRSA